ncbi:restriction endonuclease subunit S [Ferrovibrio sp.]|uniref:restriction endonuclease subunit S n=1 Tax=Ferrovibrio sp. TaxID=1917215 RepID=UPI001B3FE163|nr:restriction endonuclease subunit S [Ferrovibrio sp.]MBP7065781.1 restriction endonuclease subunit S [Ferrovibrio sp.]
MSALPARRFALGDVIELAYGKSLPKSRRKSGCVPVYGSNGVVGWHNEYIVNEPTVVIGRKGAAGAVHLTSGPSFPIDTTFFVKVRPEFNILPSFLFYALRELRLERLAIVTGVPGLNREDAYKAILAIPEINEQRRIVDILNHAASIRRLREQARAKAREIIPALFVEMFGDPATNPTGWPVKPLGDLISKFEGGKNLQAGDDEGKTGLRILKVSAVTSGVFRASESKPAPNGYKPPAAHFVRAGDLLFSRANTVDLVGATAFVQDEPRNVLLPDKLWRFVWKRNSQILPFYMLYCLRQSSIRTAMSRMATGTSDSMKNISQGKLVTLPIPVPPLALQNEFAERVAEIEGISGLNDRAATAAEQMAQSLLAQVFGPAT